MTDLAPTAKPPASTGSIRPDGPRQPGDQLAQARALLTDSAAALAKFAHTASTLSSDAQARTAAPAAASSQRLAQLTAAHQAATAQAAAAQQAAQAEVQSTSAAALAKLSKELTVSRGITDEEAGSIVSRARNEQQERTWMADTMFDSAKDRPRQEFELVRRELEPRLPQLMQLRQVAREAIRAIGLTDLPAPKLEDRAPDEPDTSSDEDVFLKPEKGEKAPPLPADVLAAVTRFGSANAAVQALINLKLPRLFAMPWPVVIAVLAGGGLGTLTLWMDAWQWHIKTPIAAGVGALLGLVALLAVRGPIRARTLHVAQAASNQVAETERAINAAIEKAAARRVKREKAIAHRREREIRQARTLAEQSASAATTKRDATLKELTERHTTSAADINARRTSETERLRSQYAAQSAALDSAHAAALADHHTRDEQERAEVSATNLRAEAELRAGWATWCEHTAARRSELLALTTAASPEWTAGAVRAPKPRPALVIGNVRQSLDSAAINSVAAMLGDATAAPLRQPFDCPVGLQTPLRGSLLVQAPAEKRAEAISVLQVAALRALLSLPPGKTRFVLIDPVALGQSFAGMMHLADSNPQFVTDRIWTETRHIEARLTDLTEHMENVIQKYLRNDFATIDDYNTFAGEVAEPYRFLVIADFPAGFSETAAAKLASIISSGPRCGVYTLIAADPRAKLPGAAGSAGTPPLSMADLERASLTLQHKNGRFVIKDEVLGKFDFSPLSPPPDDQFKALVLDAGVAAREAAKVRVGFNMLLPAAGLEWTGDTTHELRIPLGRLGASKLQYLTLGKGTAQHVLTAGRTGSGKSTLLNVIITAAATWFSPDQLALYLIDFKKGVEFRAYAAAHLPHARVVAIESEREFGLSVLRRLDAELQERGQLFRDAGAQDLAAFRAARPDTVMPRTLLIIDEFQEFFSEDDKLAAEAGLLLDRLVRQGRAFGMHVILGSQTLAGAYSLARATIGQMAVRIALQCSEADSYLILSEDNAAARLLSRPGEAIYNDASGMLEGNSPFQVAWLPDEERAAKLATARTLLETRPPRRTPEPAVVFEGNRPGKLEENHLLARLRTGHAARAAGTAASGPLRVWLGDPLSIKDPTGLAFQRQSGSNLLIVSQRDDMASGMLAACVQAAMLQLAAPAEGSSSGLRPLTVLDGTPADSNLADALRNATLASGANAMLADLVPYRDAAAAIDRLEAELSRRREADLTDAPPLLVIISQLHRFRILRKGEDDFGMGSFGTQPAEVPTDKKFAALLRDGPGYNIHCIAWCDTAANFERTVPRGTIKEFDLRVLTQMSATDSSTLIDSPNASTLGQSRALLFSESTGTVERFRPYTL